MRRKPLGRRNSDPSGSAALSRPHAHRRGHLALVIAVLQYRMVVKYLSSDPYRAITPDRHTLTPTYMASILLICIGLCALVSVATRAF